MGGFSAFALQTKPQLKADQDTIFQAASFEEFDPECSLIDLALHAQNELPQPGKHSRLFFKISLLKT